MLIPRTDDKQATAQALAAGADVLVACLCAAWCRTCDDFRSAIEAWAHQRPDVSVVWLDVEDDAELVEDIEVENFPTIVIQSGGTTRFCGPVLPRVAHVERLVEATVGAGAGAGQPGDVPDLWERLVETYLPDRSG